MMLFQRKNTLLVIGSIGLVSAATAAAIISTLDEMKSSTHFLFLATLFICLCLFAIFSKSTTKLISKESQIKRAISILRSKIKRCFVAEYTCASVASAFHRHY